MKYLVLSTGDQIIFEVPLDVIPYTGEEYHRLTDYLDEFIKERYGWMTDGHVEPTCQGVNTYDVEYVIKRNTYQVLGYVGPRPISDDERKNYRYPDYTVVVPLQLEVIEKEKDYLCVSDIIASDSSDSNSSSSESSESSSSSSDSDFARISRY